MKKYLYTLCTAALLGLATSCVDSFDATNQNPNKLYLDEIDIQKIFPGTIYKSLDVLSEMNYNYYAYMARYVVSWTSPQSSDNVGDRFYNFYKKVLGDVAIMEQKYDRDTNGNYWAILTTWKAYLYSVLTGTWGPIAGFCLQRDLRKRILLQQRSRSIYANTPLAGPGSGNFRPERNENAERPVLSVCRR